MDSGFEKANSNNLPKIDVDMINNFFVNSTKFLTAEVQNVKMKRATRENYGDSAVGHVQLKRHENTCIVKARITPEHRVRNKGYTVSVIIDEKDEVISCECHDCTASIGGCKHAIAFLMWLHRRSEEPAVTSVACYWRTSKLSEVDKNLKGCSLREMYPQQMLPPLQSAGGEFRNKFVNRGRQLGSQSLKINLGDEDAVQRISLHCLSVKYKKHTSQPVVEDFLNFCSNQISEEDYLKVQARTLAQSESPEWYNARFGRITASRIYEASRCKTYDGSLVEAIFGANKISSPHMERGLRLEKEILKKVQSELNVSIKRCGFVIKPQYPILGASPDGITDTFCIEIKCPSKIKTVSNYVDENNKICPKPYAQLQMQMFLTNKRHGLLCVASPNFEFDNEVNIVEVELDTEFCKNIIDEATQFWNTAIYSKLVQ